MGLRPARCYRDIERSYTRVANRVQAKDFIGGVPRTRVRQFVLGDQTKDFPKVIHVFSSEGLQIRDNALEAFRQKLAKVLNDICGKDNFFTKIRIYPHHVLRQNKLASGAGADRLSSGMKHAFGKPIGRSAQVKKGQNVLSIVVNPEFVDKIVISLKTIINKIHFKYNIKVEDHKDKILTGRKKWTREIKKAALETETPEATATTKDAKVDPKAKGKDGKAAGKDTKAAAAPAKEDPKAKGKDAKGKGKK
ncbi:MAG: 50S ribosomal protein L16 [Candidatus ainarchaeum sp.]|nr:50S ribosomal protein L16 [Candidatus ainarchaeum sp.]